MWMRPIGRNWQLIGMAQGYPVISLGAPAQAALPINRSDVYFTQPAVMANVERHDSALVLRTTVNFEGLTQRDGEVTFGAWGEGYLDNRHPHTVLHEAMVGLNLWEAPGGAFSLSAGRGFAPFGTDNPMARPVQKYPPITTCRRNRAMTRDTAATEGHGSRALIVRPTPPLERGRPAAPVVPPRPSAAGATASGSGTSPARNTPSTAGSAPERPGPSGVPASRC